MSQQHPTYRSLAAELGMAYSTVEYHLLRLRNRGLVAWAEGKHGTIRPLVTAHEVVAK